MYLIILQLNNFITELQYNTCANIASHIIRKYISHGRLVLSKYKFVLKVVVLVQSHLSSCWLSKFFLSQEVEASSSKHSSGASHWRNMKLETGNKGEQPTRDVTCLRPPFFRFSTMTFEVTAKRVPVK